MDAVTAPEKRIMEPEKEQSMQSARAEAAASEAKMGVEGLDLYYGEFRALKDVTLDFPKNEVTALIGPSGCGKSTLLKTLNRMNDLVDGCRVDGCVSLDGRSEERRVGKECL